MTARLLILGGSTEASALATKLAGWDGVEVVYSLAGRTATPTFPPAKVRVGGFGGSEGLAAWLGAEGIDAVVDATHPFTAQMPDNALRACDAAGLPRLRLRRAGWVPCAADRWSVVADMDTAARVVDESDAKRVFLTIGRQQLESFSAVADTWFLVRSIEAPDPLPVQQGEVLVDRGPFDEADELALLVEHRIDLLVTKNSGGSAAAAKLAAARRLEIPVVMVARPPAPAGPRAATVDEALAWCASTLGRD